VDLETLSPGQEVYYIDKSEGPGVLIYIRGVVVTSESSEVTLEVADSGVLTAPGYLTPYDPSYAPGSLVAVNLDSYRSLVSSEDFSKLREEYESIPSDDENQPAASPPAVFDEVDDSEKDEEPTREDIEEGSPDLEEEDGLYLVGSLTSWANSAEIAWPVGFPQEWMERIYQDLPEGTAPVGPNGSPDVSVPGGKGPGVPPKLRESEDLEKDYEAASEKVHQAAKAVQEAENRLKSADTENQSALEAALIHEKNLFQEAKDSFLEIKKKYQTSLVRPPGEAFEQVPGRHMPRSLAYGRAGLRQELKQLSSNYKATEELLKDTLSRDNSIEECQKEIDLIKDLGKIGAGDGNINGEDSAKPILNKLRRLKYQELKSKPYLWAPEERDKLASTTTGSEQLFNDRVGESRSFFDLPLEEVDQYIAQMAESHGRMPPEEVARRAWKYANDFQEVVKSWIESGSFSKRMQWLKFLQDYRKSAQAAQKGKLRRMLAEKDGQLIDDQKYRDAIIAVFRKYAKYSHEQDTNKKIPNRYKLEHGVPAYLEKKEEFKAIQENENRFKNELNQLEKQLLDADAEAVGDLKKRMEEVREQLEAARDQKSKIADEIGV